MSFLYFLYRWRFTSNPVKLHRLYYCTFGGKLPWEDWQRFRVNSKLDARLVQFCGWGYQISAEEVEKFLDLCGKCHNWAVITCYELSADKFLSLAVLCFLRWDMWIVSLFAVILEVYVYWIGSILTDVVEIIVQLIDTLLFVLILIDTANMRSDTLKKNQEEKKKAGHSDSIHEIMKLVSTVFLWCVYFIGIRVRASYQFLLLLFTAFIISLGMRLFVDKKPDAVALPTKVVDDE